MVATHPRGQRSLSTPPPSPNGIGLGEGTRTQPTSSDPVRPEAVVPLTTSNNVDKRVDVDLTKSTDIDDEITDTGTLANVTFAESKGVGPSHRESHKANDHAEFIGTPPLGALITSEVWLYAEVRPSTLSTGRKWKPISPGYALQSNRGSTLITYVVIATTSDQYDQHTQVCIWIALLDDLRSRKLEDLGDDEFIKLVKPIKPQSYHPAKISLDMKEMSLRLEWSKRWGDVARTQISLIRSTFESKLYPKGLDELAPTTSPKAPVSTSAVATTTDPPSQPKVRFNVVMVMMMIVVLMDHI